MTITTGRLRCCGTDCCACATLIMLTGEQWSLTKRNQLDLTSRAEQVNAGPDVGMQLSRGLPSCRANGLLCHVGK